MSSTFRLKKRNDNSQVWAFGDYASHYINPFTECHPGDIAIPIGRPDGVKVCMRRQNEQNDELVMRMKKGEKINGLYKSYNLYYPESEFQTRVFNPWPEGGQNRQEALLKDYIKVPIRYNGSGLENMGQLSGNETAYGWSLVNTPPSITQQNLPWKPQTFDVTRLNSNPQTGDLRNQLYGKYKHPFRDDFYHTKQVKANYPEYSRPAGFLPGSIKTIE